MRSLYNIAKFLLYSTKSKKCIQQMVCLTGQKIRNTIEVWSKSSSVGWPIISNWRLKTARHFRNTLGTDLDIVTHVWFGCESFPVYLQSLITPMAVDPIQANRYYWAGLQTCKMFTQARTEGKLTCLILKIPD